MEEGNELHGRNGVEGASGTADDARKQKVLDDEQAELIHHIQMMLFLTVEEDSNEEDNSMEEEVAMMEVDQPTTVARDQEVDSV